MPDVYALTEDILVVEYPLHASINLEDVQDELEKRRQINNRAHFLLVKFHGLYAFDIDAQHFLGGSEEASLTKGVAILCDNKSGYFEYGKMLLDNFLCLERLKFPAKIFDVELDAVKWLGRLCHESQQSDEQFTRQSYS